jgi:hypothetical protein
MRRTTRRRELLDHIAPPGAALRRHLRIAGRAVLAQLALARRLVDVLWALLRDGREFSPQRPTAVPATA